MRIFLLICCFILPGVFRASAQFAPDHLQIHFGYHLHNTSAKRFNHLVTAFNTERYPADIEQNLPSINFLHGFNFGAAYELNEDFLPYIVLKNKHQLLETYHNSTESYRYYQFQEYTAELGLNVVLTHPVDKKFRQYIGGGLLMGVLGVKTGTKSEPGKRAVKKGTRIDNTAVIGLTANYEAQYLLTDWLALYIRPVLQLTIPSEVRDLNAFMNPVVEDDVVIYRAVEDEKYNSGTLSGLGLEGGLILLVPEINFGK